MERKKRNKRGDGGEKRTSLGISKFFSSNHTKNCFYPNTFKIGAYYECITKYETFRIMVLSHILEKEKREQTFLISVKKLLNTKIF